MLKARLGQFSVLKAAKLLQRHVLGGERADKRAFEALSLYYVYSQNAA